MQGVSIWSLELAAYVTGSRSCPAGAIPAVTCRHVTPDPGLSSSLLREDDGVVTQFSLPNLSLPAGEPLWPRYGVN
jgi:hypothetical protein